MLHIYLYFSILYAANVFYMQIK